jgi:hypothetical protein
MCNFKTITKFIENKLDLNDKLDLLLHLDDCILCFNEIYRLKKAQDERFFRYQVSESDSNTEKKPKRQPRRSRKKAAAESTMESMDDLAMICG